MSERSILDTVYLNKNALKREILSISTSPLNEWDTWGVLSAIDRVEPADVAPVVRCKDCVYGEIDDPDFPNQYLCHYYGNIWNDGVHFCSNGEIRNDR